MLQPWHMGVPRPRTESEPQPWPMPPQRQCLMLQHSRNSRKLWGFDIFYLSQPTSCLPPLHPSHPSCCSSKQARRLQAVVLSHAMSLPEDHPDAASSTFTQLDTSLCYKIPVCSRPDSRLHSIRHFVERAISTKMNWQFLFPLWLLNPFTLASVIFYS